MKTFPKVLLSALVVISMLLPGMALADDSPDKAQDDATAPVPAASDFPFRTTYPSIAVLYAWYDTLITEYPGLVTKIDIGNSWQGRDMWVLKITSNEEGVAGDKPDVLIEANIHAREWSTSNAAAYFAWLLLYNYDTNDTIHWLVNNREIYVLPMVNPDGYFYDGNGNEAAQQMWRKNRNNSAASPNGVDLNRNWDIDWSSGNPTKTAEDYHGMAPFSEYETKCIRDFMLAYGIDTFQCLHSYAGVLLIPWCYTSGTCPHDTWYRGTAAKMTLLTSLYGVNSSHYDYGQAYEMIGYTAPGGSIDWAYDALGAQGFCFEVETGGAGFYPDSADIMIINNDIDDALVYQARIADTDIGDGTTNLFPPVPYIVYGNVYDGTGPIAGTLVTITNTATSESISVVTDSNGYFELDYGKFSSYTTAQTFHISADVYSGNFTIDSTWGKKIILAPVDPPTDLTVDWWGSGNAVLYEQGFEGDGTPTLAELGWSTGGASTDWQVAHPTGLGGNYGNPDPTSAYEGSFVIGNDLTGLGSYPGDYQPSIATNSNWIRSAAIVCTGATDVTLSFQRYLGVEQPAYDHAYIEVSTDGTTFSQVWTNPATIADSTWSLQEYDISTWADGAATVYVRFEIGSTDTAWQYCGWNIDDLLVEGNVNTGANDNNLLNWTLSADDGAGNGAVTQYNIYRSASPTGPWNSGALLDTVPAGTDTYTDIGAGETDGITWWYVVRAATAMGSEDSNAVAVPEPGGATAPYAIDLTGKPANSWVFVSFPHTVTGQINTLLNDATLGDGATTWTVAKWFNHQTPADPWKTYRVGSTANDMPAVNNQMGLWLYITANGGDQKLTLASAGDYSATAVTVNLYTGWNMVGYPSAMSRAESATLPAQADFVAVWQAATPYITQHAKGSAMMAAGNAYWVHVSIDCLWTVNPGP